MLIYSNKNANLLYPFAFDGSPLPAQLYNFDNGNISYSTDDRREVKLTTKFNYGGFTMEQTNFHWILIIGFNLGETLV